MPPLDSIDIALAALTARHAVARTSAFSETRGEWIVVPEAAPSRKRAGSPEST
jgi:hypothetical protein